MMAGDSPVGIRRSQLKSASVGLGFCVLNPSDSVRIIQAVAVSSVKLGYSYMEKKSHTSLLY